MWSGESMSVVLPQRTEQSTVFKIQDIFLVTIQYFNRLSIASSMIVAVRTTNSLVSSCSDTSVKEFP